MLARALVAMGLLVSLNAAAGVWTTTLTCAEHKELIQEQGTLIYKMPMLFGLDGTRDIVLHASEKQCRYGGSRFGYKTADGYCNVGYVCHNGGSGAENWERVGAANYDDSH